MNEKDYLRKLKRLLPLDEQKDILSDYKAHFENGKNDGKTEQEIAGELGDPYEVVKEFGYEIPKLSTKSIIFAAIGLLFFDLFIGIAVVASIFAIWISLWSVVLSLLVSGVALVLSPIAAAFVPVFPWYLGLTAGISTLGLAGLTGIGMIYVSKYYFIAMKWYFGLHVRVFQNR